MKKNVCNIIFMLMISFITIQGIYGQSEIDTIDLKKGEVLDILLLSQNADVEEALKSYFQTAFPVAQRMSYESLPGFKIVELFQGNHQPDLLILGKWSDLTNREAFLTEILEEVPDFQERRREIWPYFGLRYFEAKEDLSFEIKREKYHVATAYWVQSKNEQSEFYEKWKEEVQKNGGEILVQLSNGQSPFGYKYNPDYFVISSWDSEANFNAFQEKVQQLGMDNIYHVNEFLLK